LYLLQIDGLNLLVAKGVLEAGTSHFSKRPALCNVMVCPISSEIFMVVYPVQLILIILMPMQRDLMCPEISFQVIIVEFMIIYLHIYMYAVYLCGDF
jgi:hypothetical protein